MELPRVLQVQQFTAAREPEVRSGNAGAYPGDFKQSQVIKPAASVAYVQLRGLWESLRSLGRLDGSKLLPRHLRR
jgi:hypothetical protein